MLLAIKPGTIREAISTGYFGTMELWREPNRLFDKRRSLSVLALVLLEKLAIPVGQAGFTGKGIRDSLAPNYILRLISHPSLIASTIIRGSLQSPTA